MKLFDSHCHLDDVSYGKDIHLVIERAKEAGLLGAMVVGVTGESSAKAVEMAEADDFLYASVGIHPHDAKDCSELTLERLKVLAGSPRVKAWGEAGLDFNRMHSPRDLQERCLVRQLEVADELDLPLIFHERDSDGRFLEMIKEFYGSRPVKGVVHCFSGNMEELTQYLDMGLYIGVTGILTIKQRGEELRKLVALIPDERLLVETDAPYLTPAPEKNKTRRNEPAFVSRTLLKLAEVRWQEPEILAETIYNNTCRLYNI